MSHLEVDLKSMRSTMKALEDELGTALVSQLNTQDQQEVPFASLPFTIGEIVQKTHVKIRRSNQYFCSHADPTTKDWI